MQKGEQEKMIEGLGIKVRDENGKVRSYDDIANDLADLLKGCSPEDYGYLMMALLIAREADKPLL